jgi:hypothetical protein
MTTGSERDLDRYDEVLAHGDGEDGGIGESPHYFADTLAAVKAAERQWTIVVGIGRRDNVNGLNLTEDEWRGFRGDVDLALRVSGVEVFFAGEGVGEYAGLREDSASWIGATSVRPNVALERKLAGLARQYDQDSIAVTYGETVFVEAGGSRREV